MNKNVSIILAATCLVLTTVGCGGDSLQPIDVRNAEFSSPQDYTDYDREMQERSAGQRD